MQLAWRTLSARGRRLFVGSTRLNLDIFSYTTIDSSEEFAKATLKYGWIELIFLLRLFNF